MADHDGHTINVGPVTVGEPLAKADPIDTAAIRADACHCRQTTSNPGPKLGVTYHFSDCRVDDLIDLCDEVDRLRAEVAALRTHRVIASAREASLRHAIGSLRVENALLRGDNATLGSTVTELRDQLREALGDPT